MFELIPLMLERVGILVILAFLLSRMKSFRQIIQNEHSFSAKMILTFIFGAFGIISNYTGVHIYHESIMSPSWHFNVANNNAIANTRIMGVAIGGLIGGPIVGLGVGLIAGLHRLTLGGFTAYACAVSTIVAGIVTGLLRKRFGIQKNTSLWSIVSIGIFMECAQMGIILLIAKPFSAALHLVEVIALPMILINGLGTLIFILIIQNILQEEEKTRALQTNKALYIAQQTLPFFRQGLTPHSSSEAARIIFKLTEADAISITDHQRVLAHVGAGADHHEPMNSLATKLTKKALEEGNIITATSKDEIQCCHRDCPLNAAIVLPLKALNKTVGSLKLYYTDASKLGKVEKELANGLSKLFSTQLELAEAELQRKLVKDAEIKALQAQVHPHFLFNSLNTISSLIRTDANQARKLLIHLSTFFRNNLQGSRQTLVTLEKELEHVEAYLTLEQTRFPNKFSVEFQIEPHLKMVQIPPFTLQPLIENSIRHAFSKENKLSVIVQAYEFNNDMILITEDNGKGIPTHLISTIGNETIQSKEGTGTALWNIKKRIEEIYGDKEYFQIQSELNIGTKVSIRIPLNQERMEG
ncbi:sensor histidine kinase [Bacillus sp. AFS041924]|uniref:sensor histidine kinase n=1 Tax=Bacillus sp. AFS041924 TaxID=2033503 RepID=UPI000BFCE5CA|nr:sensor histidine kinase [Bacillus sp. AFS041924]PGS52949.1 sensor histidine kinase [Bacillus sp. AFS041924]